MNTKIMRRLSAAIAIDNVSAEVAAQPWRVARRDNQHFHPLHRLWLDVCDGFQRDEWTREELVELVAHAEECAREQREREAALLPADFHCPKCDT